MNFLSVCIAVLVLFHSLVNVYATNCITEIGIFFEPSPSGSCPRHGDIIGSTSVTGSAGNRNAITLTSCLPDGNFIIKGRGGGSFTVQVTGGLPSGSVDGHNGVIGNCPSGNFYAHAHLDGNGVALTTTEVTVVATGSGCDPVTYYLTLGNPTCASAPSPCVPSAVSVATVANTQLVTLSGIELLNPTTHVLTPAVTDNAIVLVLPAITGTTYTISHSTLDPNTNQWSAAVVLHTSVAGGNRQVDWNPARVNRYIIDVSSSEGECSTSGYIIELVNFNAIVEDSSSTGMNSLSSSSSDFVFVTSSSSSEQSGNGVGDPQFVGLRGQSFQIHGYDGAVFNIISNKHFQLNSLFVFLTGPRPCPTMPSGGQKSVACWSHDGSYLGDLGLKTNVQDELFVKPGSAEHGFERVTFNNRSVAIGEEITFEYEHDKMLVLPASSVSNPRMNQGKIHRVSTHELVIEISSFTMEIENVDGFVNIRRLGVIPESRSSTVLSSLNAHGLLGQTWQLRRYSGQVKEIEGEVDDYVVEDGLFGRDFIFNRLAFK